MTSPDPLNLLGLALPRNAYVPTEPTPIQHSRKKRTLPKVTEADRQVILDALVERPLNKRGLYRVLQTKRAHGYSYGAHADSFDGCKRCAEPWAEGRGLVLRSLWSCQSKGYVSAYRVPYPRQQGSEAQDPSSRASIRGSLRMWFLTDAGHAQRILIPLAEVRKDML